MAPVALLVAALLAGAAPVLDTVFLRNGGRVRGTVVEEDPARGVSIQLPTGELRTLLPAEIARVEYGDGTGGVVGGRPAPATPQPPPSETGLAPATSPPSAVAPLPPAEPIPPGTPAADAEPVPSEPGMHPGAVMFGLGLFGQSAGGDAEGGVSMADFTTAMTGFGLEAGLRLDPHWMLGAFLEFAAGDAGPVLERACTANGLKCTTSELKLGIMGRYAFTPTDWQTAWVGVGAGMGVLVAVPDDTRYESPAYGGMEPLRLSAGWDFRGNGIFGVGVFVTGSWSRYGSVDNADGESFVPVDTRRAHTWLQVGVRGVLFP
jgi:hypothetical protein